MKHFQPRARPLPKEDLEIALFVLLLWCRGWIRDPQTPHERVVAWVVALGFGLDWTGLGWAGLGWAGLDTVQSHLFDPPTCWEQLLSIFQKALLVLLLGTLSRSLDNTEARLDHQRIIPPENNNNNNNNNY
eukprot:scaffold2549_cov177-Ochromonas_danica.AAC.9